MFDIHWFSHKYFIGGISGKKIIKDLVGNRHILGAEAVAVSYVQGRAFIEITVQCRLRQWAGS
jgi:hypothetical protein